MHFAHARRRAMERYGIEWNEALRARMVDQIRRGHNLIGKRQSISRTVFRMFFGPHPDRGLDRRVEVRVVYCKTTKEIITFLPLEGEDTDE